jgi:hypothetical protein
MWHGIYDDRATAYSIPGDKVIITGGEYKNRIGVFLSHKPKTVEVQLKRGEIGKYLRPYHVEPIKEIDSCQITPRVTPVSVHRGASRSKPAASIAQQTEPGYTVVGTLADSMTEIASSTSSPFVAIPSINPPCSPKMAKLVQLVDEEMNRIYCSIAVVNALVQAMTLADEEEAKLPARVFDDTDL